MRRDTNDKRRLAFHKETLRQLTTEDLDLVAGAGGPDPRGPKSNAWTGDMDGNCILAGCF